MYEGWIVSGFSTTHAASHVQDMIRQLAGIESRRGHVWSGVAGTFAGGKSSCTV